MNKMTVSSIKDFTNKKKYAKIIDELDKIILLINVTQRGFSVFKHYISVQEIVSVLESNKTLLSLQKHKYEKLLKDYEKN